MLLVHRVQHVLTPNHIVQTTFVVSIANYCPCPIATLCRMLYTRCVYAKIVMHSMIRQWHDSIDYGDS